MVKFKKMRVEKVLKGMEEQGIDGLFLMREANIRYISGFTGGDSFVLLTPHHKIFITDSRYTEQAEQECPGFEIVQYLGSCPGLEETISNLAEVHRIKKIGFEQDDVTFKIYDKLRRTLGNKTELVPTSGLVEAVRLVKDVREIACIKRAAEIVDEVFTYILGVIKQGPREKDIAIEIEYQMKKKGASHPAFSTIVASGPRGSLPHAIPSERVIKTGDLITMDFGAVYQGYCSDITRTVSVGEPTEKQKEIYRIVKEAQEAGLNAVRAGIEGSAADKAARDVIEKAGYGPNFGHGLGHGVGLEIHEEPSLNTKCRKVLAAGSVVTVEPGIYIPNWGGVRIEDTVLVTEEGCEILTHATKDLITIN
ncbi:MAG: M24 family metallopeptidase [Bacillota bacterium]